jgi:hypothetical protein
METADSMLADPINHVADGRYDNIGPVMRDIVRAFVCNDQFPVICARRKLGMRGPPSVGVDGIVKRRLLRNDYLGRYSPPEGACKLTQRNPPD